MAVGRGSGGASGGRGRAAAAPPSSPAKPRKPPSARGRGDDATADCREELQIAEDAVDTNAQKAKKDSNAQQAKKDSNAQRARNTTNAADKEAGNDARESSRRVEDLAQRRALDEANAEKEKLLRENKKLEERLQRLKQPTAKSPAKPKITNGMRRSKKVIACWPIVVCDPTSDSVLCRNRRCSAEQTQRKPCTLG
jgi:hypothetical protein